MKSNYPGKYFKRYIKTFFTKDFKPDEHGFEVFAKYYLDYAGLDEFSELADEIESIDKNNDWHSFETNASGHKNYLSMDDLKLFAGATTIVYKNYRKESEKDRIGSGSDKYEEAVKKTKERNFSLIYYANTKLFSAEASKYDPKRSGLFFLLLGVLLDIIVLYVILFGNLKEKDSSAPLFFYILGFIGVILIVLGIINLTSKRPKH